jgi:hypothetical protein
MAGIFLLNPYARHPLPEAATQVARRFCQRVD